MLDDAEKKGFDNVVSWLPCGLGFKVHIPSQFTANIMPTYFNQTKYKSFQRQLNMYGFHRLVKGRDRGACTHPLFVKGKKELCNRMVRAKVKRRSKKLVTAYHNDDCSRTTVSSEETSSEDEMGSESQVQERIHDESQSVCQENECLTSLLSTNQAAKPQPIVSADDDLGMWLQETSLPDPRPLNEMNGPSDDMSFVPMPSSTYHVDLIDKIADNYEELRMFKDFVEIFAM